MPTFTLQFPASEIEALANRFGYADDTRLVAAGAAERARGYYAREVFLDVCALKMARSRSKVASNTEAAVIEATRRALAAADDATRISALLELAGVGDGRRAKDREGRSCPDLAANPGPRTCQAVHGRGAHLGHPAYRRDSAAGSSTPASS